MKKYLVLFCAFLISTSLFAQQKLTLTEAVSIALQRNSNVIKFQNNLEVNKSNLKSAWGNLLPSLGASGSWGWQRITDIGGTQIDEFGVPRVFGASETESRDFSLGAGGNVTLFDGLANYANISGRSDDLESAKLDFERLKENTVFQTMEFYYNVLRQAELVKVREDNVQFNKKFLEQVQERNRLGSVAIADVYSQQVQLGNAELLLIQQQNLFENSKSTLLNFLALDVLEDYEFVDPFAEAKELKSDSFQSQFGDITSLVSEALTNRKDYQSQKYSLQSAESGVSAAFGGVLPSLTGNYGFSTRATEPGNLFDRKAYSLGLTLSLPIFSNFNTENRIQIAEVSAKNVEEDLTALERQIKVEVKQGYQDFQAAKKGLDVATKNLTSAEENRRINYERYNLGSGTILDVLQADRDYSVAISNKIDATFEFYRLKDRLVNYLGKLNYKDFE
ncbi:MAG: TolC family protein [Bacteroidetes bacterium]|nr:TolC family protein [Bacteroidota bacterium]